MNKNRFEGDPKIIVTQDGWDLQYKGGQPVMDQGIENIVTISLLTKEGWIGNIFLTEKQKIGSRVRELAAGTITISKLNDIRQAAEKTLDVDVFGNVISTVTNPVSSYVKLNILIQPKGSDIQELTLQKNGQNWINQAGDPAYRRIT
ncbi:MAG TPA: hypothetical protein VMV32_00280 [Ignavibacteriaceae bacterium]|nr:hypothetical protein [Ignavibacteriaceae bacterium]